MIVSCAKCDTEFSLDMQNVGPEGMILRCSVCAHMFCVEPLESQEIAAREPWQVCSENQILFSVANVQELVRLLEDGQIGPEHKLSKTGKHWVRIGDMPEFASIFGAFDGLPKLFRAVEPSSSRISQVASIPSDTDDEEEETPSKKVLTFHTGSHKIVVHDDDQKEPGKPLVTRSVSSVYTSAKSPTKEIVGLHETSETEKPEVVVVKVERKKANKMWPIALYALLGIAVGTGIVFAIPGIRREIWPDESSDSSSPPTKISEVKTENSAQVQTSQVPQAMGWAVEARRSLSQEGMEQAERRLQKLIDHPQTSSADKRKARFLQAELLATRALALTIAAAVDATAMDGLARLQSREDQQWAENLVSELSQADAHDLASLTLLLGIPSARDANTFLPLRTQVDEEVWLWLEARPLWRSPDAPVADELLEKMRELRQPSTLTESLVALAHMRKGEVDVAREQIAKILERVPDQPLALSLQRVVNHSQPNKEVPPQQAIEGQTVQTPDEKAGSTSRPRPATPAMSVEEMTKVGCSYIDEGKLDQGIAMLMRVMDKLDKTPIQLALCMGRAYAKKGHKASALAYYERVLQQQANHRQALAGAAGLARELNRSEQAISLYQRLLTIDPQNAAALAYLREKGLIKKSGPSPDEDGLLPASD